MGRDRARVPSMNVMAMFSLHHCFAATTRGLASVDSESTKVEAEITMSAAMSYESIYRISLATLLAPMQFKTVLLVACGLKHSEIAQLLGTRERVIEDALRDIYDRTGCANSRDLVLRYVHEVESGLLELTRLRRELEELEARSAQILKSCG